MSNQATKKQIQDSFLKAIEEAKNPDQRVKNKKLRGKKKIKASKKFGL